MSLPSNPPNVQKTGGRWQYQLEGMYIFMPLMMTRIRLDKGSSVTSRLKDYCKRAKYQPPTFSLFSDRRGNPVPFLCLHARV